MGGAAVDAVVVGAGHNGLVAAAYLARAGKRVVVLERRDRLGGAVASERPWPGVDALVSRYAYLVSLLPQRIVDDLGLDLELRPRPAAPHPLAAEIAQLAAAVFPTLLERVPSRAQLRERLGDDNLWERVFERPLGEWLEERIADDGLRGGVLTDALVGVHTGAHDPSLLQNRCFLLHVIGTTWNVPVGGMGRVAAQLERVARAAGAQIRTGVEVQAIDADDAGGAVRTAGGSIQARHVLAAVAPGVLARLLGDAPAQSQAPRGAQLKVNMLLRALPGGENFAGTVHRHCGYAELARARESASAGRLPDPLPVDVYCHSLTDDSILGPELRAAGAQTLTCFAFHVPAGIDRDAGVRAVLRSLPEGTEDLLWRDADGRPCLEAHTQEDLEADLAMPGGHIFHRNPGWPFDDERAGTRGVETERAAVLLCGAGALRGGGVSGIPGFHAAQAVIEQPSL
jgi:phytoene dehydrogenase-like protein